MKSQPETILELAVINIQGLTQDKQTELEHSVTSNTILCLTETQHRFLKVNIDDIIAHNATYTFILRWKG